MIIPFSLSLFSMRLFLSFFLFFFSCVVLDDSFLSRSSFTLLSILVRLVTTAAGYHIYIALSLSLSLSMFVAKAAAAAASTNYFYSLYRETGAFPSFRLQLTNCGTIKNARCCCCFSCPFPFLFSSFGYPASSLMVNANQRERETTFT